MTSPASRSLADLFIYFLGRSAAARTQVGLTVSGVDLCKISGSVRSSHKTVSDYTIRQTKPYTKHSTMSVPYSL